MYRALVITGEVERATELDDKLSSAGISCFIAEDSESITDYIITQNPDFALVDMDDSSPAGSRESLLTDIKSAKAIERVPIIILVSKDTLGTIKTMPEVDDFIVEPLDTDELVVRINKIVKRSTEYNNKELIRYGDLAMDLAKCEVYVSNKLVNLTFMEYELLKFLAANGGRVCSRSKLLNEVWGYDYYGGDRTVDVHIRRLRSKIEDATHSFIETVRNIGYKFRDNI